MQSGGTDTGLVSGAAHRVDLRGQLLGGMLHVLRSHGRGSAAHVLGAKAAAPAEGVVPESGRVLRRHLEAALRIQIPARGRLVPAAATGCRRRQRRRLGHVRVQ